MRQTRFIHRTWERFRHSKLFLAFVRDKAEAAGVAPEQYFNDVIKGGGSIEPTPDPEVLTRVLTKKPFGRSKLFNAPDTTKALTTSFSFELEAEFTAVRFGYLNLHTAAIPGMKFCMAVTDSVHSASYVQASQPTGGGVFIDGSFPECPPRVAADLPSLTWGNWIELASIPQASGRPRPLIMGRIEMPAGFPCTGQANGMYGWNDVTLGKRIIRAVSQNLDGVTNKAGWVGGANPNNPGLAPTNWENALIPVIQYRTKVDGKQVMLIGDSTVQGLGASVKDFGAVQVAALGKSTPANPIECYNAGIHSAGYAVYSRAAELYAPGVAPTDVFYYPWSVNDSAAGGHADAVIAALKVRSEAVAASLAALPVKPQLTLLEPLPCTTAFKNLGAGDAKRRTFITDYLPNQTYAKVATGYAAAVSGVEENGQTQPIAAKMFDGAHPNDTGYADLAAKVTI